MILTSSLFPSPARVSDPDLARGNRVELLRDGEETFLRMFEEIRNARRYILVEMYTFGDDSVGQRFARALSERAQAGVDVRVTYDSLGSKATLREFFGWMRSQGVRVLEYHPKHWFFHGTRIRRRNHRKVIVVDDRVAFIGGLNFTREYASVEEGGKGWRDTQIEIRGPAVADLARSTLDVRAREGRRNREPDLRIVRPGPLEDGIPVLILSSHRLRNRLEIGGHYLRALQRAKERIWIANSYFLPPRRFRKELKRAAGRGVDVRLILPERCDFPPVLLAAQSLYAQYLKWGIRIFEWTGPMMHAKTAVIDGAWSTVGSYNIDPLSLLHNEEVTAIMTGEEFGGRMESMFEQDLASCRELDASAWKRRSWLRKRLEDFFYLFRGIL